jgi:DNA-binding NarL/FixJ family response regulator
MRVLVADDAVLLREGIARILTEAGHDVVAQTGDADELLALVRADAPDLAIVDIRMPPRGTDDGLRAAETIRAELPAVAVLVLSQYVEEQYVTRLLDRGPAGVGYLLKERVADVPAFLDAVERVAGGGSALDPEVVAQMLDRPPVPSPVALTPRETDVIALIAEGLSNRALAGRLGISDRAIERHITSIFAKLRLPDTGDEHRRVLAVLAYLGGGG